MPRPTRRRARVIVVAGPSGTGKSRLAQRLGLPVLTLDDFYKEGGDPTLPRLDLAGGAPIVDWDSPASWHAGAAMATIEALCATGKADAPIYDIARSARTGHRVLELRGATHFVAEGIFAQEIVAECHRRDLLADALCLTQHPALTFARRLGRDLRERRKPPLVLVRRGVHLALEQERVVARAVSMGCRPVSSDQAYREMLALVADR